MKEGSLAERFKASDSGAQGSGTKSFGWLFVSIDKALYSIPWFGGHVKPSVPSEVPFTHFYI